ncbi:MAG: DJ-1/PfpI family protein [Myxococcota bacterium]
MSDAAGAWTLGAVLYDQFEMLDVYGPLEMFAWVGPELRIVSVARTAGPVAPAHGPKTLADHGFGDCPPLDLLLVPGGLGTIAALEDASLLAFLQERAASARLTMSVCTGSALLAKAGVLDGLRATSNKQFFDLSVEQRPDVDWVTEARWVDAGRVVTSSGVSAGMDMALAVIDRLFGKDRAERIETLTEYTRQRDPSVDPFVKHLNEAIPGR